MKILLKFEVPDKGCEGCRFHRYESKEIFYNYYDKWEQCTLFDCIINQSQKCISCESCEVNKNE